MPSRAGRASLAGAALTACLVDGLLLLALVGLVSPARFGLQGSRAFGSGPPTVALIGIAAACGLWVYARRGAHRWVVAKIGEPFRRPLEEDPAFAGASAALAAAPGPLRTRFAVTWIWFPVAGAVIAATAGLSAAYFLVDAVLARFEVGWQQPVLAAADLIVAGALFRLGAGRLAVWPLAVAVHQEATTGYP
jgi:hypothetical protein